MFPQCIFMHVAARLQSNVVWLLDYVENIPAKFNVNVNIISFTIKSLSMQADNFLVLKIEYTLLRVS